MASEESGRVFYLADYPQTSVQDWANLIFKNTNKNNRLKSIPIFVLKIIAKLGDIFRVIGLNAPLTSQRLNNMLVSKKYPIENTKKIVGSLPFNREDAVIQTLEWINSENK